MRTKQINIYKFEELSDLAKEKAREWWRRCQDGDNYWSEFTIEEAVEQGQLLGIEFKEHDVKTIGGKTYGKPCIWWSGFWSQGDGACFEGTWHASKVNADKVADGWGDSPETKEIKRIAEGLTEIAKRFPYCSFKVRQVGYYSHSHSTSFDLYSGVDDMTHEQLEDRWKSGDDPGWNDKNILDVQQLWKDRAEDEFEAVHDTLIELARDFMDWIYKRLEQEWEYQNSDEMVDYVLINNDYEFEEDGSIA